MKKLIVLMFAFMALTVSAVPSYAAREIKSERVAKRAVRELTQVQKMVDKLPRDADGHLAKASELIVQATRELTIVKDAPKTL